MKEMFVSNANETVVTELDDSSVTVLYRSGISIVEADGVTLAVYRMLKNKSQDGVVKTSDLENASPIFKAQINQ